MTRKCVYNQPFSIGQLIKDELIRQERTVTWLAHQVNCDRRNIYHIFSRADIDTDMLFRISLALHTDFFAYYSNKLQYAENQSFTPPHYIDTATEAIISLRETA